MVETYRKYCVHVQDLFVSGRELKSIAHCVREGNIFSLSATRWQENPSLWSQVTFQALVASLWSHVLSGGIPSHIISAPGPTQGEVYSLVLPLFLSEVLFQVLPGGTQSGQDREYPQDRSGATSASPSPRQGMEQDFGQDQ